MAWSLLRRGSCKLLLRHLARGEMTLGEGSRRIAEMGKPTTVQSSLSILKDMLNFEFSPTYRYVVVKGRGIRRGGFKGLARCLYL